MAQNLVAWCNVPWSRSLFQMPKLSQCSLFLILAGQRCCCSMNVLFIFFIRQFDVLCHGDVNPSLCPSVRPSFPDFFAISIWNLVYAFSNWRDMSSFGFITIGSLWPSLQPKVGETQFLQSWPYKSRQILQIWYVDGLLYTSWHKFRFLQKSYFWNFGDYFCAFCILRSFPGFFSTCFELSIWNMVYTFSR